MLLTQRLAVSVKQFGYQTNGSNGRPGRVLKVQTAGLHGVSTLLLLLNCYVSSESSAFFAGFARRAVSQPGSGLLFSVSFVPPIREQFSLTVRSVPRTTW